MAVLPLFVSWRRPLAVVAGIGLALSAPASAEKTASDYYVHSLPGAPEGPLLKMHAGHIEVTPEHNGNMFFWHYQNQHIANKQRTVIWINGGPGCSSEDGALMEIGPYRLKDDHTLVYNDGAWTEFANVLFVDNPVGTGFSYVDTNAYLHELDEMADQFIIFLEKWFALFPEYEHDDLYIAGESYAGQHIPYIAKAILERNKKPEAKYKWALSGLLIGNGWISPPDHYQAYLKMAYSHGLITKDSDVAKRLEMQYRICQKQLAVSQDPHVDINECESILNTLLSETSTIGLDGQRKCINMYDVRLRDVYPSCGMNWPPDLVNVTPYLRRADVVAALNVDPNKSTGWSECSGTVGSNFRARNSKPSIEFLPRLVEEVPVLLFSGDQDLICNHYGTESLISNMEWNGAKGFEIAPGTWAPRRYWTVEGEPAGFWQEARNLTYVLFYNSSHMVPFDHPRRTRDMLDRFIGVDISSIGGTPTDSLIDGEKGPETTVGGAAGNGTAAQEAEKAKLDAAKWQAYRKSGTVVLVIVTIAASAWGWWVWRDRRRRSGYKGIAGGDLGGSTSVLMVTPGGEREHGRHRGLDGFRNSRGGAGAGRDVEAADFDESELDDLHVASPTDGTHDGRYGVGEESDEDEDGALGKVKGEQNGGGNGQAGEK